MRYILFQLDPFDYSARYKIMDGERVEISKILPGGLSVRQLGQFLATQSHDFSAYHIEVLCPVEFYEELEKDILEAEQKTYSENKIVVEKIDA